MISKVLRRHFEDVTKGNIPDIVAEALVWDLLSALFSKSHEGAGLAGDGTLITSRGVVKDREVEHLVNCQTSAFALGGLIVIGSTVDHLAQAILALLTFVGAESGLLVLTLLAEALLLESVVS